MGLQCSKLNFSNTVRQIEKKMDEQNDGRNGLINCYSNQKNRREISTALCPRVKINVKDKEETKMKENDQNFDRHSHQERGRF